MKKFTNNELSLFLRIIRYAFIRFNKIKFLLKGVKFGKNLRVYQTIYLPKFSLKESMYGVIEIGDNFEFTSGAGINPLCRNISGAIIINKGAEIKIGDNVGMSSTCLWSHKSITIGNNVKIGGDTIILDSDCHSLNYIDRRSSDDLIYKIDKPIIIGDDVLIGARCIVLKGVTIGARSVIGSGSVVTKDIPADCIAAGNPCRVIRDTSHENLNKEKIIIND